MKISSFCFLCIVFLFSAGCSSVTLQLNKCRNEVKFSEVYKEDSGLIEDLHFSELTTYRTTFFSHREVELSKLLDENKRKCSELKKVELEIEENFGLFNKIILRF